VFAVAKAARTAAARLSTDVSAAAKNWWTDDCLLWGAALAFHSLLSLAPLLYALVYALGAFIDDPAWQDEFVNAIGRYGGSEVVAVAKAVVTSIAQHERSAADLGASLLIATAAGSAVFSQLQQTLNHIWSCEAHGAGNWKDTLLSRMLAGAMVLFFGATLLASAVVAWLAAAIGRYAVYVLPSAERSLAALDASVSWLLMTVAIACIFRWLPQIHISWSIALLGGATTAALFLVGKLAVSSYIRWADVGTAFGAAGSVVVFVVWVYYTSQTFLFGAELTAVWASLRPCGPQENTER
jgi:membrane protein